MSKPSKETVEILRSLYGRNWKKELARYSETMADHMARRPAHISLNTWTLWYFAPFGEPTMNEKVVRLRAELAGEVPPPDFIMPERFTLKTAMRIFGVDA